jgi:phosphate ABC transporter phosphate-binding protein
MRLLVAAVLLTGAGCNKPAESGKAAESGKTKVQLNFTGEVLADIYLGKITQWNDPKIKAINPGVELPDTKIAVVYRSDGSGSTNIFTDYLCKVSEPFKEKIPSAGTKVNFPVGSGENGTAGVAGFVKNTPNSIGYVELTYALQNKIQYGKVKNKAGQFVAASLDSVRAAATQAFKENPPHDDLRFSITDAPGEGSYPLAGTTWAVLYTEQSPEAGKALVDFFTWVLHDGQKFASGLDYTPLPDDLVTTIDAKLKTIKGADGKAGGEKAKLRGAGSSFVKPMMDRWTAEYAKTMGGDVNYQATGSTNGIKSMIDKAVDFGATDAFLLKLQLDQARAKGGDVLHIPLVMGGIVPAYNLEAASTK